MSTIEVGDWVRADSKGIWQAVRQAPEHYEPRYSLRTPKKLTDEPLWLLKRLVDDRWKPAFAVEAASGSSLKPLNKADRQKLERFLRDHPDVQDNFAAFKQVPSVVLNLPFSLPRKSDYKVFQHALAQTFAEPLAKGVSHDDILKVIAKSPFAEGLAQTPRMATLQFVCEDLEVRRRYLVYRQLNIQPF